MYVPVDLHSIVVHSVHEKSVPFKISANMPRSMRTDSHTLHSLHHWYAVLFEKFGWMLLARHQGEDLKIAAYVESTQRLSETIQHKIRITQSDDKRNDLKIMATNMVVLTSNLNMLMASQRRRDLH